MLFCFEQTKKKFCLRRLMRYKKLLQLKRRNKDYEDLLIKLSEIKTFTDNFFDNVVVNDENQDIKNNRLELLKMFCNTFNNFVNFSKLRRHLMKQLIYLVLTKHLQKSSKIKKDILGGKGANLGEMGKVRFTSSTRFYIINRSV